MQRRDAVLRAMKDHPISQRRACVLIGVDPKTVRREHPPDNPEIRSEMNKIAEKRRRFGYRRIGVMLERVGMVMNEKKLTEFIGKRACRCAAVVAANGRAAVGHLCRCHCGRTSAGHWTFCPTPSGPAGSSASWRSTTIAAVKTSASLQTPASAGSGSRGNWMRSSGSTENPPA